MENDWMPTVYSILSDASSLFAVDGDTRTVRQCAIRAREDLRCVERTGTMAVKVKYCECEGDLCNAAPAIFNVKIVLLTVVSALAALVFHS